MKFRLRLSVLYFIPTIVFAQPKINSFSPLSAPAGSIVTINGQNFGATVQDNIVYFGPVKATVVSAATNQLAVQAPTAAGYSLITVITGGLVAQSLYSFSLSFPDADTAFAPTAFKRIPYGPPGHYFTFRGDMASEDLNNDGKPEILLPGQHPQDWFSIFPNTSTMGNISFGTEIIVGGTSATATENFTLADLDGDGRKEIIGLNENYDFASISRNISTGNNITFEPAQTFTVSNDPTGISTTDLNGDGKLDIITSDNGYRVISILKNTSVHGSISFSHSEFNVGANNSELVVRDIDGDDKPDIVVAAYEKFIMVMRNISTVDSIAFSQPENYQVGSYIRSLAGGDLDGDGKADIVLSHHNGGEYNTGKLSVFKNNSSPGNISFEPRITLDGRDAPRDVRITDMDGDGKPDLVCNDARGSTILLFKNKSQPGLIQLDKYKEFKTESNYFCYGLLTTDLDGDSRPDMITGIDDGGSGYYLAIFQNKICDPAITNASPLISYTDSVVTIEGRNLSNVTGIKFGGTPAKSFNIISRERITAVVGSGSTGQISATNQYGSGTNLQFLFSPPPTFSYLSHLEAGKGTAVSIYGNNFNGVLSVNFGGVPADTFTVNSPTQITAIVGNGASGPVMVRTVTGTGTYPFFVYAPKPEILSFEPQSAGTGDTIRIKGTGLSFVNSVILGNVNAKSFGKISDTLIKAVVGDISSGNVIVSGPGGKDTLPGFVHKGPLINSYSSPNGCIEPGVEVTLKGINFLTANSVMLGEVPAISFTVVSDSVITAIPGVVKSGNVKITTTFGIATWLLPRARPLSVTPATAKEGDTVLIKGKYFCSINSVIFYSTPAKSFRIISDSVLEAVVPAEGNNIIVVGTSGTGFIPFNHLGPQIQYISPSSGGTGTVITINGKNFTGTASVKVGSVPVSSFSVDSDIKITAVIANGPSDTVKVTSPNGTGRGGYFTNTDPRITSIVPDSGKQSDTIFINGSNFNTVQSVLIGGIPSASFNIVAPGLIRVILGEGNSGPVTLNYPMGSVLFGNFEFIKSFELCPDASVTLTSGKSGSNYQWQVNRGNGFEPIADTGIYSGTNTAILGFNGISSAFYGYRYRCIVDSQFSNTFQLKFKNTWTGSSNSNWEDPANWVCGQLPDQNTDVIIVSGNVIVNSNVICRSLTVGAGVTVTVTAGHTITITH